MNIFRPTPAERAPSGAWRVRYIADTLEQALEAAKREHGAAVHIAHVGTLPATRAHGRAHGCAFEVVVQLQSAASTNRGDDASSHQEERRRARTTSPAPVTRARRAARLALARATIAARGAAREAAEAVEAAVRATAAPVVEHAVIARLAARLRMQSLPEELVAQVLERARAEIGADVHAPEVAAVARAAAIRAIAALLPVEVPEPPRPRGAEGRPHVVAVAGATGVGKTTTVAKLAAGYRAEHGLRVGLIAADAFRVGAVDQLRTYASIIGAPLRAADGAASVRDALAALAHCDVVIIDTPGRGHRDAERIAEVCALLQAARPDETHLLLSGNASAGTLLHGADAFAGVGATRVVLSKLDESEGLGALVGAVRRCGRAASWFTTGQEVPDDVERADARVFAQRLVGDARVLEGAFDVAEELR